MEAVKISNLSYKYPSADEYCLKNVSFSVSEGEVCAIVGPNGCGKTTICNIIRGLIPSFHGGEVEGSVEIFGKSAKEISEEYDIDPKRSASLLDIFTSVGQGMIPYGAQLLSAATLTGLTPFDIIPNLFYPVLMGVSAILFIVFKKQN